MVIDAIAEEITPSTSGELDVLIVGAGPAGMSAGLRATELGLHTLILDQQGAGGTILQYPRRKLVMVQPVEIPRFGRLPNLEYSKEDLLAIWEDLYEINGLDIQVGVRVTGVQGPEDNFVVSTSDGDIITRRVVLALGRRGTPRRLNVPGEDLAKVAYKLIDAEAYRNRRVLVVGGGDSAVEAAMGLAHQEGTQVTLSYRKPELLRIKQRNADRIAEAIAAGRIDFRGSSTVRTIDQDTVVLDCDESPLIIPNDDVFILAGGIPPFGFLRQVGIKFGGDQVDLQIVEATGSQAG